MRRGIGGERHSVIFKISNTMTANLITFETKDSSGQPLTITLFYDKHDMFCVTLQEQGVSEFVHEHSPELMPAFKAYQRQVKKHTIQGVERTETRSSLFDEVYAMGIKRSDPATRLAMDFSLVIKKWLSTQDIKTVIERNATEGYKNCCATHDFCDANQAMIDAYQIAFGKELDLQENIALVNKAWDIAKAEKFYTK
jgi:hypothetical protein